MFTQLVFPLSAVKLIVVERWSYANLLICDAAGCIRAGVCAMCGKQVIDTKFYKQSNV